jgi:hypothetical protein
MRIGWGGGTLVVLFVGERKREKISICLNLGVSEFLLGVAV